MTTTWSGCSTTSPASRSARAWPGRPGSARRPRSRSRAEGIGMGTDDLSQALADRLAVTDVVVRWFELVDAKAWDRMHEVLTDDTTARWTPEVLVQGRDRIVAATRHMIRSEEHTSELQSLAYLVCRLLLEKKKTNAIS